MGIEKHFPSAQKEFLRSLLNQEITLVECYFFKGRYNKSCLFEELEGYFRFLFNGKIEMWIAGYPTDAGDRLLVYEGNEGFTNMEEFDTSSWAGNVFWQDKLHQKIVNIEILKDVPTEVGLLFTLENTEAFIVIDISDDVQMMHAKNLDQSLIRIPI